MGKITEKLMATLVKTKTFKAAFMAELLKVAPHLYFKDETVVKDVKVTKPAIIDHVDKVEPKKKRRYTRHKKETK